jgi:DNA-binding CsgD family transcriptional regulator
MYFPPREFEVALLYAAGNTPEDIGAMLHISPHTVRSYLQRIYERTSTRDRTNLALWFCRNGGLHVLYLLTVATVRRQAADIEIDDEVA